MQAGVVGEQSVVTQCHVLLLPLLVEGFTASLQQHALQHNSVNNINPRTKGLLYMVTAEWRLKHLEKTQMCVVAKSSRRILTGGLCQQSRSKPGSEQRKV